MGAGVQGRFESPHVQALRIAFLSVGPAQMWAYNAQAPATGKALSPAVIADAQNAPEDDLDPDADAQTSKTMRLHLARVLLGRMLRSLARETSDVGGRK